MAFAVDYRNREGSPADWVHVMVGGATHAMQINGSEDWKDGVRFTWSGKLPAGIHEVVFEGMSRDRFSDSLDAGLVTIAPLPTPAPTATPKPTPKPTPTSTPAPTATPRPTAPTRPDPDRHPDIDARAGRAADRRARHPAPTAPGPTGTPPGTPAGVPAPSADPDPAQRRRAGTPLRRRTTPSG